MDRNLKISVPTRAKFIGTKDTWYKIEKETWFLERLQDKEKDLENFLIQIYNEYKNKNQPQSILNIPQTADILFDDIPNKAFEIQNRRYLGNKHKLLKFIDQVIKKNCTDVKTFCDIFGGTGVVGHFFNTRYGIISNDLLYSNYVALQSFLETNELGNLQEKINYLNSLLPTPNYYSENFGNTYFSLENAMKIGTIREEIEKIAENENQKNLLITSLIYASDKVANTVGHYDAFRKKMDMLKPLELLMPLISLQHNQNNKVYNQDANQLINEIESDVLYIDPPYNSRQYSDAYHLLENLAENKKPIVFGKAKKMDREKIKSNYCTKEATNSFQDLIYKANTRYILVSYNNTGEKKDGRSNARISDKEIIRILETRGKTQIFEKEYKAFSTGKSDSKGHTERVFFCEVQSQPQTTSQIF